MPELGKLTAVFDADTKRFDSGVRGVQTKLVAVTNQLHQVTGSANPATTALTGLSTKLGVAAGASVIAASAISAVAVGLFNLLRSSAEVGGQLLDLSQKTNFTVETLSGLSIVAKTTGSDIQGLSASLGIFQKNMFAAGDPTSKQGELFRKLSLDVLDNEKALRQAFTQLNKMGDGAQQTAVAMQLFGRSGKDVLAIVKETNGNLDAAIQKYDKMGLIISHGAAAASDKFNDVLEETTLQLSAVTRSIGMELLPVATETLQEISYWLAQNKGAWSSWGNTISDVLRGVKTIASSEIGQIIGFIARLSFEITGLPGLVREIGKLGASQKPGEDFFGPGGAGRGGRASLPGTPEYLAAQRRLAGLTNRGFGGGGGGGRRGGGGGGGSPRQDPGVQLLKHLEEQLRDLTPRTEAQKAAEKVLGEEFKKTTDTVKKKIQITAMDIDLQKMVLGITRERVIAMKTERQEFEEMIELVREANQVRQRTTMDLTGLLGTDSTRPRVWAQGQSRERIATVEEQVMRERLAIVRQQMEGLATDLTGIFDRALYDGIHGGGKRGLQSLALGFLDLIQQVILGQLRKALAEALSTGASGSGWLAKILGWVIGGVAGGVGGGGASGLASGALGGLTGGSLAGRATGGPVSAHTPYLVGERGPELFMPRASGQIVPNTRVGGTTINNIMVTTPAPRMQSFHQRKSQRQLAEMIAALATP